MASLFNFWNKHNCFRIEHNELKPKVFIYTNPLRISRFGLSALNFRPLLIADSINKYLRLNNKNTNFTISLNDLNLTHFLECKEEYNKLEDISLKKVIDEINLLNVGYSEDNLITFSNSNSIYFMQRLFIELYNLGFIKYGDISVTYDSNTKKIIDKNISNKSLKSHKGFYLDFTSICSSLSNDIKTLGISSNYKDELLSFLETKDVYNLELNLLSSNLKFSAKFLDFGLIGGLTCCLLSLNSNYKDFVANEELYGLDDFLNSDTTYFFTGNFCINPLTGAEIPIFLAKDISNNCYIVSNEENKDLIKNLGLDYIDVLLDSKLVNSDFLDGFDVDSASDVILNNFLEEGFIKVSKEYTNSFLLLSSLDQFGLVAPVAFKNDDIIPLLNFIPMTYSTHFRLQIPNINNLNIDHKLKNITLNTSFLNGCDFLYKILYDPNIVLSDILDPINSSFYSSWFKKVLFVCDDTDLFNNLFVPLLFRSLFNKIFDVTNFLPEVFITKGIRDLNGLSVSKYNCNLFNLSSFFNKFEQDSIRLYFLNEKITKDIVLNEDEFIKYHKFLQSLTRFFKNSSDVFNYDFDQLFLRFRKSLNDALFSYDFNLYIDDLYKFYNDKIKFEKIKKEQLLDFLILLFIVAPDKAEELNNNYFDSNFSIMDQIWK